MASPPAHRGTSRATLSWPEHLPWPARVVFLGLVVVVLLLAITGAFDLGGEGVRTFFDTWLSGGAEWVTAILCGVGAMRSTRNRGAWIFVTVAMFSWAIGDTIWSIRGDPQAVATVSDIFWLAWYPLMIVALVLLVRERVPRFELHRWIDGIVVMLVVITPFVAFFLEPAAQHANTSALEDVIDFAYPLGDTILVGAALGVLALMGWRAGPMWLALVIGFAALGLADGIYSVDALGHTYTSDTVFDALWLGGLVVLAYAAWLPHPGRLEPIEVYGWRAIALPLAAQGFAVALQIYGLFFFVPVAERTLTIVVLLIAMVQIVVSRPRPPREVEEEREALGL